MVDTGQLIADDELQTSVEKLDGALEELASAQVDATHAVLVSTFRATLPMLRRSGMIPTDPAELDATLLACARWCVGMRSDTAWQPETMDELFMGPEPATDGTADPLGEAPAASSTVDPLDDVASPDEPNGAERSDGEAPR